MKRAIGAVLIVIGLIALSAGGVFWTRNKKVLDLGSVEVTAPKHEGVAMSPVVGFVTLVGGILLVALPGRRSA